MVSMKLETMAPVKVEYKDSSEIWSHKKRLISEVVPIKEEIDQGILLKKYLGFHKLRKRKRDKKQ